MKFKTRGAAKNLSLDTSTWPPKVRSFDGKPEDSRPRTATLDKPLVLDIALLGHLDMTTLTRRGLLKVCRFPNANKSSSKGNAQGQGKGVIGVLGVMSPPLLAHQRQPSRASSRSDLSGDEDNLAPLKVRNRRGSTLVRQKKPTIEEEKESMWADDNAGVISDTERFGTFRVKRNNRLNRTYRIPGLNKGSKRQPPAPATNNNISDCVDRNEDDVVAAVMAQRGGHRRSSRTPIEEVFSGPGLKERVPEPCRTCGRPEQPERFHSHPKAPGPPKASVQHHGFGHLPEGNPRAVILRDSEVLLKKTVKKPVPIKYRPRKGSTENVESSPLGGDTRSRSPGKQTGAGRAGKQADPLGLGVTQFLDADGGSPSRLRGPRTVICFVCSREFGTASLPLHEPHCVQKWLTQNSKLPPQWQRQLPQKPVGPITIEDWNKFASESSKDEEKRAKIDQRRRIIPPESRMAYMEVLRTDWYHLKSDEYLGTDSVQCPNCLRRFLPDRINSHERVCFEKQQTPGTEPRAQPEHVSPNKGSPLVECYLCGKKFGTRSIGIHEPQCLRKWQQVNGDRSPPLNPALGHPAIDKPREYPKLKAPADPKPLAIEFPVVPVPVAPTPAPAAQPRSKSVERPRSAWAGEQGALPQPAQQQPPAPAPAQGPAKAPPAAASLKQRSQPLRCYLCGQMFGLQSLPIHEPQCLQKWRLANAKLPPHLRRPEPEKPEIIFTEDGEVNRDATAEAAWQAHLSQLIPCSQCGRRFSPERISVHERCCKGGDK